MNPTATTNSKTAPTIQQIQAANRIAEQTILRRSTNFLQSIASATYVNATGNVAAVQPQIVVKPQNVGLVRGFYVEVTAVITNNSAVQLDLADFSPATVCNFQFVDLQNNTRIQTTGVHIANLNSIRHRRGFMTALDKTAFTNGNSGAAMGYDNLFSPISAPATIAAAAMGEPGVGTITMLYYVPLAYAPDDLRGSIYFNVLQSTAQLTIIPNPNPCVANATDSSTALYVGHAAGSVATAYMTSFSFNVYQDYLDNLPIANGAVLLPQLSLGVIYDLKNTAGSAITQNQDYPVPYANLRDFLSLMWIYTNTAATGARSPNGADITYTALQAANTTNIIKTDPTLWAGILRNHLKTDLPPGMMYFGFRQKPISTTQFGNMQQVLNASLAGTGAYLQLFYEAFAYLNTIRLGGSLAAG